MLRVAFLIPLLPLAGFLILLASGRKLGNPLAGWLATIMVAASFVVTVVVFAGLFNLPVGGRSYTQSWFTWISSGHLHVDMGILVDPLSMTMAAFVTGVSALIHLYSIGYMAHDEDFPKFFLYLNLFVSSMLVLVLADNFLLLFLGWEGVGVCSYFLIGFWFERDTASSAAKKAMIFNRLGDAAFLVALFLIYERTGSLEYHTVFAHIGSVGEPSLVAIGLLLFGGAVGKSAQIPLYPWLRRDGRPHPRLGTHPRCDDGDSWRLFDVPDQPDPVPCSGRGPCRGHRRGRDSLVGRNDRLCTKRHQEDPRLLDDLPTRLHVPCRGHRRVRRRHLPHAHPCVLQGAVVPRRRLGHPRDERRAGREDHGRSGRLMPITAVTFFIGWLSIGGVPVLSGFWSKGDVFLNAFGFSPALWAVGAVTAVLTAYYLGRVAYLLVFRGEQRRVEAKPGGDKDGLHPHDPRG